MSAESAGVLAQGPCRPFGGFIQISVTAPGWQKGLTAALIMSPQHCELSKRVFVRIQWCPGILHFRPTPWSTHLSRVF